MKQVVSQYFKNWSILKETLENNILQSPYNFPWGTISIMHFNQSMGGGMENMGSNTPACPADDPSQTNSESHPCMKPDRNNPHINLSFLCGTCLSSLRKKVFLAWNLVFTCTLWEKILILQAWYKSWIDFQSKFNCYWLIRRKYSFTYLYTGQ